MNFAEALRKKIKRSFWSYRENAEDVGLTEATLRAYAHETYNPSPETKRKLYEHFRLHEYGVELDDNNS